MGHTVSIKVRTYVLGVAENIASGPLILTI
jgi:hypothetical protein